MALINLVQKFNQKNDWHSMQVINGVTYNVIKLDAYY